MKARLFYTSDRNYDEGEIVEFNSLEQLISFIGENGECILDTTIYGEKFKEVCDFELEIYNDYRE